jgi:chromosome segregation ATPase
MPRNPTATEQLATLKDQVLALQEELDDRDLHLGMAHDAARTMRQEIDEARNALASAQIAVKGLLGALAESTRCLSAERAMGDRVNSTIKALRLDNAALTGALEESRTRRAEAETVVDGLRRTLETSERNYEALRNTRDSSQDRIDCLVRTNDALRGVIHKVEAAVNAPLFPSAFSIR